MTYGFFQCVDESCLFMMYIETLSRCILRLLLSIYDIGFFQCVDETSLFIMYGFFQCVDVSCRFFFQFMTYGFFQCLDAAPGGYVMAMVC